MTAIARKILGERVGGIESAVTMAALRRKVRKKNWREMRCSKEIARNAVDG